jgi:hypothetical protein
MNLTNVIIKARKPKKSGVNCLLAPTSGLGFYALFLHRALPYANAGSLSGFYSFSFLI